MDEDDILSPEESDREERLFGIVRAYTAAIDAGEKPDRRALMRQNPDIAADLSACLGGLTFLNQAADKLAATAEDLIDPTAAGPQVLGDYRLHKEIGRGGMGVVYEAEQISLGRRVAVKVLPTAAALDSRQLQRFKSEAQAAAHLNHPHIVPVYAVGTDRSTHFYAMMLIDGQSLADVIHDLRDLAENGASLAMPEASSPSQASTPSIGLSTMRGNRRLSFYQTVARLGLQAAEALHHAHHSGVVHRDIKPANLMLDSAASLWITDFGLAQFYAEENNLTQTTDRPGTLRYMSPEQAGGEALVLDQRTDIYSLGVTLYELLTLERAVPGDTREQLLNRLQNEDPRPARQVDSAIPKELETILMTAYAKDPADRYPTAGLLAEDLRRFLADQPILAKSPPFTARLARWVRRHRNVAATAAVVTLVLLGGFIVSTVLIAHEQAKTREAYFNERDRAFDAERERKRAQNSFAEARDAVAFFARIATGDMDDERAVGEVRREMLEAAVDYYERFIHEHRSDRALARELGDAQTQVGRLLTELESVEEAARYRTFVRLLNESAVAKDLALTATQSNRARNMYGELRTGRFGGEALGDPANGSANSTQRERLIRLGTQLRAALDGLLTPPQFDRLRQIARQVRGPGAFADPDVIKALDLTPEQRDAARTIIAMNRSSTRRPMMTGGPRMMDDGPFGGPGGGPGGMNGPGGRWMRGGRPPDELAESVPDAFNRFEPAAKPAPDSRTQAVDALLHLLNPAQLAVWYDLTGRTFADADRYDTENDRRRNFDDRGYRGDHAPPPGGFGP